ncbi:hypothetical protein AB9K26_06920 [Psychroserpens sp. XS_ASV72]|uniref:hypothetical protein n=1 Tax=Psychroserpens sp. XS_ASV72 TaxID=3241293 RepID=UPI00351706AA
MAIDKKHILYIFGSIVVMLLIPFIAMQFTEEVQWSLFDFIVAGILLFVFLFLGALFLQLKKPLLKYVAVLALVILFVLLWLELAVGIFGSPISGS